MKKLTKKYRVIFDPNTKELIDNPLLEYSLESETYVGEGRESAEFDSSNEVEIFIQKNGLKKI